VPPVALRRCAVVAWNGSREAIRAVHDALPLLRLSRSVQIVMAFPASAREDDVDAQSLSGHLLHHGLKLAPKISRIRAHDEHAALRQEIDLGRYDLLVMGGYSHAIWFEFIFGGATQSLLLSAKIPILISP
jgi:nucleotide-binding universal stress UspA family protein